MIKPVIADTGPLVAFLNSRDHFHKWSCENFKALCPPLLTCEAVIAEACFLLGTKQNFVLELIRSGVLTVRFNLEKELGAVEALIQKYKSVPMSLADACLVRMSETIPNSIIFTLDEDFRIYRKCARQVIPCIFPDL